MPPRKGRRLGYTFKEAAAALDISITTLFEAYRAGDITALKFGSNIPRITPGELLRIRKMLDGYDITVEAHELIRQTIALEKAAAERIAAEQAAAASEELEAATEPNGGSV